MSHTPSETVTTLINRLAKTVHDPRRSMIYGDFGTEFHAGYFPATFDQKRLLGHIAMGLWREYPDTPRFIGTYRRPGRGRNFLTLYFAALTEKQNIEKVIDNAIRQECALTGENPDRLGHRIYAGRGHHYNAIARTCWRESHGVLKL